MERPDDAHVVDLRRAASDASIATGATMRSRPRWPAPVAAVAAALVAMMVLVSDDGDSGVPVVPTPAPSPSGATAERSSGTGTGPLRAGRPESAVAPVGTAMTLVLATRPIDGGPVDFIRVESATGTATRLDNRALLGLAEIDDIRFFGPDAAVAQLADGSYLSIDIGDDRIDMASLVDVTATAAATPLGLDALSPDGRHAWVESPYGFFQWDLRADRVVGRWLDRDGDLDRLPTPRLAVAAGLVADAGGDTYLIEGSTARRLDIAGEVVAGVDGWVLTRRCDATLDCGDLELVDLVSFETIELRDERFRQRCGLMASVPPGSLEVEDAVAVVLQRFGSSALVVAGRDGVSSVLALHPFPLGCLDATVLDDGRVVVVGETTITYVDGLDIEVVTTFRLGRTLAATAVATSP